ncbi:hypothetical protein [Actinomadura sp. 21ATH]|uniref:hypothetical protein n=1 Tax=Actinomadura sp. 21ATH TaxID=1735444 RepID=UPI0035BF4964
MTSPRTPEEEPGGDQPRAASPEDPAAPPPPRWLEEPQGTDDALLPPEAAALPSPPYGIPQDPEGGADIAETTIADPGGDDAMRTETFSPKSAGAPTPPAEPPAPESGPAPDVTVTDLSPFLPSAGTPADSGSGAAKTQQFSSPQPPAPEPGPGPSEAAPTSQFPYAQQIPGTPMAAPTPQPPAPQPPAPQPPAPPAPEPFPWAQEIPGQNAPPPTPPAPAPAPPAPEPFPWAQEIPGQNAPGPRQPEAGPAAVPLAPPPQIDEPWRTAPSGKKKRGGGKLGKRLLLVGGAGLAVAALVAGGIVAVSALTGEDGTAGGGARLAGSVFPMDAAARTDGHDQEITGVAAAGSTVVAVGGEAGPQSTRGLFLVSSDGGRTFKPAKPEGTGGGAPAAVGGSANGWVAVGTRPGGAGAVWTSENGQDWRREPNAVGDAFAPNTRVRRIVSAGNGFLAIGESTRKGDYSDALPVAWLSADGRRWEARHDDQIGLQVRNAKLGLVEAAASGDVILLEGLITPDRGKGGFRRVWRSEDGGRTWADSEVPVPRGSRGLSIGGGPAGFVAMREIKAGGKSYGQAFTSRDGASWTQTGRLETPGYRVTSRLLSDDRGYAAVIARGGDILVSRSADGAAWRDAGSLPSRPGREVRDAALAGEQTVAVGLEPGGGDLDPLLSVWDAGGGTIPVDLAKVPGALRSDHSVVAVGATGDRAVSVGSAAGDAAVWTSQDGGTWKAAQGLGAAFTRPGSQQLTGVVNGAAGWLAVGYDQTAPRRPLVVTSADGTTWQSVDTTAPFRGSSKGQPATAAAAAGPAGYVIVGTEGTSGATWFSADLKQWERGRSAGRDGALESQNGDTRWMLGAAGGSFGYSAVGGVRDPRTGNHPAVWSSADGKQWTLQQLPLPGGVTEGHLTHVAAKGDTLVAAGVAATPQGLVWLGYVSADGGKTWRSLPAPGGDAKAVVTSLAGTPKGFAATGTTGTAGAADVVAWTSADGSSWTADTPGGEGLGGDGDQQITGLAPFRDKLIGIGRTSGQDGEQPVLWNRPLS